MQITEYTPSIPPNSILRRSRCPSYIDPSILDRALSFLDESRFLQEILESRAIWNL